MRTTRVLLAVALALALWLAGPTPAHAIRIAVFAAGEINPIRVLSLIDQTFGAGTATQVTSEALEIPGLLANFDALLATRKELTSGFSGLSPAAAAQVISYVGVGPSQGAVVLFPGDWTNNLGPRPPEMLDTRIQTLFLNALAFAAASGHGYVGELTGAELGVNQLGLFPGAAEPLTTFPDAVDTVSLTTAGGGHPVTAGVAFPFTPNPETFPFIFAPARTVISGVPPANILAVWADGVPAVIASAFVAPVAPGDILLYVTNLAATLSRSSTRPRTR